MDVEKAQSIIREYVQRNQIHDDMGGALKVLADNECETNFDLLYRAVEDKVFQAITQEDLDRFIKALASNCTGQSYKFVEFSFRYGAAEIMSDDAFEDVVYGLEADSLNSATNPCLTLLDDRGQLDRLSQGMHDSVLKRLGKRVAFPPAYLQSR